ncbi:MAG: AAA family ATPase [Patescibacteria group bacterium]
MDSKKKYILDFSPGETELKLREAFRRDIIGQEEAIERVVGLIMKSSAVEGRLRDPMKPAGTLFFLGPTGVGKTYLVKVMAKHLFGSPEAITRIDCQEFQHEHEIARLIGAPDGYLGNDKEPYLTQWKIDRPGFEAWAANSKGYRQLQGASVRLDQLEVEIAEARSEAEELSSEAETRNSQAEELKKKIRENALNHKEDSERCIKEMGDLIKRFKDQKKRLDDLEKEQEIVKQMRGQLLVRHGYRPGAYPAIVLFDEIEKAHPALFKLILSIIDEARLTLLSQTEDKRGNKKFERETLFHNAIICFTSNLAQDEIAKTLKGNTSIGFGRSATGTKHGDLHKNICEMVLARLEDTNYSRLPPEFLARIGRENIIVFHNLNRAHIREGLDRVIISRVLERYNAALPITLEITESAREWLVDRSQEKDNKMFGMRSLESVFGKSIEESLAKLASKSSAEGGIIAGDMITIDLVPDGAGGKKLEFCRAERVASQLAAAERIKNQLQIAPPGTPSGPRIVRPFQLLKKK